MAVIIGSARGDERGKAHGGKAGDQTGRELSTQNWYLHKKGWVVLRPKSPEAAKKVAKAMRAEMDAIKIDRDGKKGKQDRLGATVKALSADEFDALPKKLQKELKEFR